MATPAQIAANRRNAQKSTGPKTKRGKAISSQNARQHGLFSRTFRPEDLVSKRLVELQFRSLMEEHPPQTPEHQALLQELALRLCLSDELFALDLRVFNMVTRRQKGIRPTIFALSRVAKLSHDNSDRIYSIYRDNPDLFRQRGANPSNEPNQRQKLTALSLQDQCADTRKQKKSNNEANPQAIQNPESKDRIPPKSNVSRSVPVSAPPRLSVKISQIPLEPEKDRRTP